MFLSNYQYLCPSWYTHCFPVKFQSNNLLCCIVMCWLMTTYSFAVFTNWIKISEWHGESITKSRIVYMEISVSMGWVGSTVCGRGYTFNRLHLKDSLYTPTDPFIPEWWKSHVVNYVFKWDDVLIFIFPYSMMHTYIHIYIYIYIYVYIYTLVLQFKCCLPWSGVDWRTCH